MLLFITKKQFCKLFYNYTAMIYEENGKKLSQKQKMILKNRIEKVSNDFKLKNILKKLFTKKKK